MRLFNYQLLNVGFYTNFDHGQVWAENSDHARSVAAEIISYKTKLMQAALDNTDFGITVDIDFKESDIEIEDVTAFIDIVEDAKTAFFAVIAKFTNNGDISPDISAKFDDACNSVVKDMLFYGNKI